MNDRNSVNQAEWDDLDNWNLPYAIYFSKKDSRVFVLKKKGLGWTINAGHKAGGAIMVGLYLLLPAIMIIGALVTSKIIRAR
jgi:uncharacterized membrane protein